MSTNLIVDETVLLACDNTSGSAILFLHSQRGSAASLDFHSHSFRDTPYSRYIVNQINCFLQTTRSCINRTTLIGRKRLRRNHDCIFIHSDLIVGQAFY